MKLFRKCLILFLALLLVLSFASCGKEFGTNTVDGGEAKYDVSPSGLPRGDGYYSSPSMDYPISDKMGYGDVGVAGVGEPVGEYEFIYPSAGLITASAWNENINYDFWKSLFFKGQTDDENGKFYDFYEYNRWGFDSTQRVTVTVKNGETPVAGAAVTCFDGDGVKRFAAKTGADGVAYLFPEIKEGTIKVESGSFTAEAPFAAATCDVDIQLGGAEAKQNTIKIMLVLDVTGSMGDELSYLQTELEDVISRVAAANDGVKIEVALLFYRDDYDAEKFAYHDFVTVTEKEGLEIQLKNLRGQRADGGDDYPEAVDEALEMAMSKAWGDDTSTKIIFHLLDAPPHSNEHNPQRNYEERFEKAVRTAAEKGIRICPILCSGADTLCEYLVRQEAIYTGGTFIFVTDHSGIGGEHLDPNIPDAVVEKLNDLMVRVIDGYHTGVFAEPTPWEPAETTETQNGTPISEPDVVYY